MTEWRYFYGNGKLDGNGRMDNFPPKSPAWRKFRDLKKMKENEQEEIKKRWDAIQKLAQSEENDRGKSKGSKFRIPTETKDGTEQATEQGKEVIDAVNAALYLRRPLLITGNPGTGKTSLAYAIAYELKLGPVLTWSITTRSTLQDGLYRYDAIARLQDTEQKENKDIGDYIQLGPVGTAFLPSSLPRVLLIDEVDKSDINLPNDLLNLFEEGAFDIPELIRRAKDASDDDDANRVEVRTQDRGIKASINRGQVRCAEFPVVIMTSNGEREFPPAFLRRCLRVKMPDPSTAALKNIVKAHFETEEAFQKTYVGTD